MNGLVCFACEEEFVDTDIIVEVWYLDVTLSPPRFKSNYAHLNCPKHPKK